MNLLRWIGIALAALLLSTLRDGAAGRRYGGLERIFFFGHG
ncbi:MAG: hypothetical protein ACE15F_11205 [bacterium]